MSSLTYLLCRWLRERSPSSGFTARSRGLQGQDWRIVYRIDADAIVILEVFAKTTRQTPQSVIDTCKRRLKHYDSLEVRDGRLARRLSFWASTSRRLHSSK